MKLRSVLSWWIVNWWMWGRGRRSTNINYNNIHSPFNYQALINLQALPVYVYFNNISSHYNGTPFVYVQLFDCAYQSCF